MTSIKQDERKQKPGSLEPAPAGQAAEYCDSSLGRRWGRGQPPISQKRIQNMGAM